MLAQEEIGAAIMGTAHVSLGADGREYSTIDIHSTRNIAKDKGVPIIEVEIAALERKVIPLRYLRNIGTITVEGQKRLLSSTIAVAGVGGLGGQITDQLARLGCGRIIIIDPDRFSEEDLNRQMCTENHLAEVKVAVVAARIKEINSAVTVTCHANAITQENIHELIKEANVVLDGLDNVPSRLIVEAACRYLGVPFVHGAIIGFGGQVMTIFPKDKGLSYIYDQHISLHGRGVELQVGNLATTIRLVAAWEVQEVIKIITGIGDLRHNRLFLLDIREGTVHEIKLN